MSDVEKTAGSSTRSGDYQVAGHSASSPKTGDKSVEYLTETDSRDELLGTTQGEVKRQLKARHISMIALGGTIGTGLFISSGSALSAGPVLGLISYFFITSLAYFVTQSLGEMATLIPVTGSFTQFITRWCSPALGAANGWNYWFSWAITFALELSVIGQVIGFWTDKVPLAAWITIFFVLLTAANMAPVKFYGEFEFWIASIKIIAVVGWLLYAFIMVVGGSHQGPIGFRYWRHPGPWGAGAGLVSNLNTDRLLAWVSSLISACFTFQGVELTGMSCGESKNPRKAVPSAIRKVIWRIIIFYVLLMFFMGLLVPYNDPRLTPGSDDAYSSSSPFIIAMNNCGTKVLPDIFNAVILIAIISAGNSNIYCGSRVLYALAEAKVAPPQFAWTTKQGVPYVAVLFTAAFGALGYLAVNTTGNTAFTWLLNITAVSGLIAWVNITFCHIRFMNILRSRGMLRDSLPFKARFNPFGAWYATVLGGILVFVQGYSAFFSITPTKFFTAYISVIFFVVSWVVAHFYFNGKNAFTWRSLMIPLEDCDIESGVREIDDAIWEDDEPKGLWQKFWAVVA